MTIPLRRLIKQIAVSFLIGAVFGSLSAKQLPAPPRAGYQDIECFGLEDIDTQTRYRRAQEADRPHLPKQERLWKKTLRCRSFVNGNVEIFDAAEWWVRR